MKFFGTITNGKFEVLEYIKQLAKYNGKKVVVEIKLDKPKRSNDQNEYYWLIVVGLISEHIGYTPNEVHEILKQEFLGKELKLGKNSYTIATTTKENTIEFEQYLSNIRQWASIELGIYIPLPRE